MLSDTLRPDNAHFFQDAQDMRLGHAQFVRDFPGRLVCLIQGTDFSNERKFSCWLRRIVNVLSQGPSLSQSQVAPRIAHHGSWLRVYKGMRPTERMTAVELTAYI